MNCHKGTKTSSHEMTVVYLHTLSCGIKQVLNTNQKLLFLFHKKETLQIEFFRIETDS